VLLTMLMRPMVNSPDSTPRYEWRHRSVARRRSVGHQGCPLGLLMAVVTVGSGMAR